jgi:hypothetical protein
MMTLRRLLPLALVPLILAGCSSEPVAPVPQSAPNLGLIDDLLGTTTGVVGSILKGLLSCNVAQSASATQTVGSGGGIVRVGPHSLYIPPGALYRNVEITATAPAGKVVAVDFAPRGLRFARPTMLRMSYSECGLVSGLFLRIVYVDDNQSIVEVLPLLGNDLLRQEVGGKLTHFSSYVIAE